MPSLMVGIVFSVEPLEQLERCLRSIEDEIPSVEKRGVQVSGLLIKTPKSSPKYPQRFFGKIIESKSENLAVNRNLILENCLADWVYFTDPDCVLRAGSLETLVLRALQEPKRESIFAVAGPNILKTRSGNLNQAFKWLGSSRWIHGGTAQLAVKGHDFLSRHSPTCNILYFMDKISGARFSTEFSRVGEDLDLNLRLSRQGSRILVVTDAAVYHEQAPQLFAYLKKVYGYGRAQTQLLRHHFRNCVNPRLMVLYGTVAVLLVSLPSPIGAAWVLGLTLSLGLFVFVLEYLRFKDRKNFFYFLWFITSVYLTYLFGQCSGLWPHTREERSAEPIGAKIGNE